MSNNSSLGSEASFNIEFLYYTLLLSINISVCFLRYIKICQVGLKFMLNTKVDLNVHDYNILLQVFAINIDSTNRQGIDMNLGATHNYQLF